MKALLNDQHRPRDQQKQQHDFTERCLVEAVEQFQADPGTGEQRRQSDHEKFDRVLGDRKLFGRTWGSRKDQWLTTNHKSMGNSPQAGTLIVLSW